MLQARSIRRWTACVVIVGILFSQLAVSAHACSTVAGEPEAGASRQGEQTPTQALPGDKHGAGSAALCQTHCQDGQKTLGDGTASHVLPVFVPASMMLLAADAPRLLPATFQTTDLFRATSPPLSIRNCCFRI